MAEFETYNLQTTKHMLFYWPILWFIKLQYLTAHNWQKWKSIPDMSLP